MLVVYGGLPSPVCFLAPPDDAGESATRRGRCVEGWLETGSSFAVDLLNELPKSKEQGEVCTKTWFSWRH